MLKYSILMSSLLLCACTSSKESTDTSAVEGSGGPSIEYSPSGDTTGTLCDYSQSEFNADESVNLTSTADWSCDDSTRYLTANGVPDHEVGTFPNANNPTAISEQTVEVSFPLNPEVIHDSGSETRTVAYCLNGVKFEVNTAGTCDDSGDCSAIGNDGQWRMEAVGENAFDFGEDENHGHVQPTGSYHYHGVPEGFVEKLGLGEAMTLIGWAVDGFPIYARYGYSNATDASSDIKVVTGSYVLKETPDADRPSTDIYGLGAFTQDWEYAAGSGDLDECNGRFGVTPEFPDGIYHYYLTDSFPFGQRCVKGDAPAELGPGGGGGGGQQGGEPPACEDVPEGQPCCGDGFCGGPENAENCPEDCE